MDSAQPRRAEQEHMGGNCREADGGSAQERKAVRTVEKGIRKKGGREERRKEGGQGGARELTLVDISGQICHELRYAR